MALDDVAEHLLLPTPVAQPSGNTPEEHLRKKPGRERVTDLAIIAENGLLETGGKLLPTPAAMDGSGGRVSAEMGGTRDSGAKRSVTLATAVHHTLLPTPRATDGPKGGPNQRGSSGDMMLPSAVCQLLPTTTAMDYKASGGREGSPNVTLTDAIVRGRGATPDPSINWGPYEPAIRRWEAVLGRPAPAPTEPNAKGNHRLSPRFTEWMMGVPEGWITGLVTHKGISRNEQLKAAGNGVVPQQAAAALKDMLGAFGVKTHTTKPLGPDDNRPSMDEQEEQ